MGPAYAGIARNGYETIYSEGEKFEESERQKKSGKDVMRQFLQMACLFIGQESSADFLHGKESGSAYMICSH